MKKILITGESGFIGKNILQSLKERYEVSCPTRATLNLLDRESVNQYLEHEQFDVVVHAANPNPVKNSLDHQERMVEDSLRMFMNLYDRRDRYEKLIYLGSGAEYSKGRDLEGVKEEEIGDYVPEDGYGFAKYMMNQLARQSENVYNMRLFACFGPYDHASKFITHAIRCSLQGEPITIKQNCWFDYMYIENLINVLEWAIEETPKYHDYNVCSGKPITLKSIAKEVAKQVRDVPIQLLAPGYNKSYTGDSSRLRQEMGEFQRVSLEEGIARQVKWQKEEES